MTELISEDHSGFIKGRQTQDNIRRTLHVIDEVQRRGESVLLLSLDTENAFDSVNWKVLYLCFEKFGFNTDSVNVIKTLYHDPKARIKINGNLINWLKLERTRQGCCLSPTLFAIFIEPLAQAIQEDENIAGTEMKGTDQNVIRDESNFWFYLPKLMNRLDSFYHLSG